jgi:AraC family transcriptional regulator of adaptative response / DNA-3-methyladenine glycosylase II
MQLDPKTCEKARLSRDARFDGRFFTGVLTTGIYCRPICPAPAPKSKNVRYFPSAAAASQAGLRPCLRCRPEASPGTPAWLGTSETVSRGLALIDAGALDDGSVDALAARLDVTPRHLSRLFREHLGAPPVAIAQTRRLLFAKKLINETDLSMADIAFSAGFGSVRRFNAVFLATYDRQPSALRKEKEADDDTSSKPGTESELVLRLPYRAPFDWHAIASFLGPRAIPGVEAVDQESYRRVVRVTTSTGTDTTGFIEVRPRSDKPCLELKLRLSDSRHLLQIVSRVRRLFDLGADPVEINSVLSSDPLLRPLVRQRPGLRVPGAWDGFELAVRAILGQQVTVKGATTLSGRLVERFGEPLDGKASSGLERTFPTPESLAEAELERIGMPRTRAAAIRRLAAAVAGGELNFEASGDIGASFERLTRLPGVGDWTAQYIAMRALGEPDAFPSSDLGLLKAAATDGGQLTPAQLRQASHAWRQWRAYAAIHLWHDPRASRPARRSRASNRTGDTR